MKQLVMLRAINLGPKRRVAMAELRELLEAAGFGEVKTYLQSGNAVLSSELAPTELERECAALVSERFGFEIAVLARTADELAQVVSANPLGDVAENPKRYQVSFLSGELPAARVRALHALALPAERLAIIGREAYAWHPDGVARSKLSSALASPSLGVTATARNWTTVTALLRMAGATA
jgi:uncharacterized protein (DUF1697 family)